MYTKSALNEGPLGKDSPRETHDSVEQYFNIELPSKMVNPATPYWIIAYAPKVKAHPCLPGHSRHSNTETVELIHHMNILSSRSNDLNKEEEEDHRIIATYDRGALPYVFPRRSKDGRFMYGIILNDPTRPVLQLEWHLLTPLCWNWTTAKPVLENSGFE